MGQLKTKKEYHLLRKLAHCTTGCTIVWALWNAPMNQTQVKVLLGSITLIGIALEFYRFKNPQFNRFVLRIVSPFARAEESTKISGLSFMFLGATLASWITDQWLAGLFILYVSIADPIGALFGKKFGKLKIYKEKSLVGFLVIFFSVLFINFIFIQTDSLVAIFGLSIIAATAESFSPLDDNLSIPLFCSLFTFALNY